MEVWYKRKGFMLAKRYRIRGRLILAVCHGWESRHQRGRREVRQRVRVGVGGRAADREKRHSRPFDAPKNPPSGRMFPNRFSSHTVFVWSRGEALSYPCVYSGFGLEGEGVASLSTLAHKVRQLKPIVFTPPEAQQAFGASRSTASSMGNNRRHSLNVFFTFWG